MKIVLIFLISIIGSQITEGFSLSKLFKSKKKYFVIRTSINGLVLEPSENREVKLQHFTGFAPQLWSMKKASNGKYLLVNKKSDKVLDIEVFSFPKMKVIVSKKAGKHGSKTQQWYINSDDTIVNGAKNIYALDTRKSYKKQNGAGRPLYVDLKQPGSRNQKFTFQYV